MKREKVDYVYIESLGKKLEITRGEDAGINSIYVTIPKNQGTLYWRFIGKKRLEKKMKKYDLAKSVWDADEEMAQKLGIAQKLFQARKQELLTHKEYLFKRFSKAKAGERRKILVVLQSKDWSEEDLYSLLFTAKDYYEELYLCGKTNEEQLQALVGKFYEEWGVVIHLIAENCFLKEKWNFILFLLEEWEEKKIIPYSFTGAYVVIRTKRNLQYPVTQGRQLRGIYQGFLYEKEGKPVAGRMAVNFAWQNPDFYQAQGISFVALCPLECYNKENEEKERGCLDDIRKDR